MHKVKIIAVGRIKERALSMLIDEYTKRLGRYCAIEIIEIANESISARESDAGIIKHQLAEAERIMGRIRAGSYVTALDMSGQSVNSIEFSQKLNTNTGKYVESIFIIGGSHGLHPDVLTHVNYTWSISELTFPHQLVRLILLEQLYRAFKIINNETYHK